MGSNPKHLGIVLIGLLGAAVSLSSQVPVPVTREPRHHVVYETPEYRILNVDIPSGDTSLDHSHDFDLVTIAMTDRALTRIQAPGLPWGPTRPRRPLGDVSVAEYTGKPERHLIQNVGDIPYLLFAVENLRKGNWAAGTPVTARGTTLTAESRAFRVYDARLVPDLTQIFHTHASTTIAVLIGGRVMSAGAENKAFGPEAPVGLKQLVQTGEWVLIPAGDSHHLVRLGTADARVVEIEVR